MSAAIVRRIAFTLAALTCLPDPVLAANARTLLRDASAALDAGRLDEAVAAYRQAEDAATSPAGKSAGANGAGFALLRFHRPADAIPHLERAVAADPANKVAWNNLGSALLTRYECGQGDRAVLARALEAFRKAGAIDSAYAAPNIALATSYDQQETAIADAVAARNGKPAAAPAATGNSRSYAAAGDAAEKAADPDLALANYARAEAVAGTGKGRANAANLSGLVELRRHRPEQALEHFRRATAADGTNRYAWNNRGAAARVAYSCGGDRARLDEAVAAFKRVGEIDPAYRPENREWADKELALLAGPQPQTAAPAAESTAAAPAAAAAPTAPAAPAAPPQAAAAPAPASPAAH